MSKLIPQLQPLAYPSDNPELVRTACFHAGWHLRSPHDWQYMDLFIAKEDVVTIAGLIEALERKQERLNGLSSAKR